MRVLSAKEIVSETIDHLQKNLNSMPIGAITAVMFYKSLDCNMSNLEIGDILSKHIPVINMRIRHTTEVQIYYDHICVSVNN